MSIDKSDPYAQLPRGGNMARRIVSAGSGQNLGANMNEASKGMVGQDQLDEALGEVARLKRELAEANTRIVGLEKDRHDLVEEQGRVCNELVDVRKELKAAEARVAGGLAPAKARPWEDMGISKATYYNRKKEGKL
jgi:septal ring factor EnvC (AmiA/AmiB activator)